MPGGVQSAREIDLPTNQLEKLSTFITQYQVVSKLLQLDDTCI